MKLEQRKLSKVKTVAAKQLEYLKSLKVSLNEAKEDLVDEPHQQAALERMPEIHIEIKKERTIGRRGGGKSSASTPVNAAHDVWMLAGTAEG